MGEYVLNKKQEEFIVNKTKEIIKQAPQKLGNLLIWKLSSDLIMENFYKNEKYKYSYDIINSSIRGKYGRGVIKVLTVDLKENKIKDITIFSQDIKQLIKRIILVLNKN